MDSFDKDNCGVNSSKFRITCKTDDSLSKKLIDQKRKPMDEWILKRQEAWKFQEELLRSLTNKPTKDGHVLDELSSQKAKEMKDVHEELLRMVETRERKMEERRMFVPRRVFLFNVDTFKDSQQVKGFENPKTAASDPGNSVSTPEVDGSLQSHIKLTAAKCSCEVQRFKDQGVFRRLKKYFGF